MKMVVKEYIGKGEKLYKAFMDLENAYDRAERNALKIYGEGTVIGGNTCIL